jgi:DNA polymerase-3 subunit epsilon
MNFLAIDVETANTDYSSICQIGIVEFTNSEISKKWVTLVNPETYFDPFNSSIHGITEEDVVDAPNFNEVYNELRDILSNKYLVHHMPFDKVAINRVCEKYNLETISTNWIDSAKVVRRTWDQFSKKGYGLKNVANFLNIEFNHHDALEDAIAAAQIFTIASKIRGLSAEEWSIRINKSISANHGRTYSTITNREGNPDGPLNGEIVVFTGTLFLPKSELSIISSNLGCKVSNSITKSTTMLIVGTQDAYKLAGHSKSSKHRKAEDLNKNGSSIRILSESDFIDICNNEDATLNLKAEERERPNKNVTTQISATGITITFKLEDASDDT